MTAGLLAACACGGTRPGTVCDGFLESVWTVGCELCGHLAACHGPVPVPAPPLAAPAACLYCGLTPASRVAYEPDDPVLAPRLLCEADYAALVAAGEVIAPEDAAPAPAPVTRRGA